MLSQLSPFAAFQEFSGAHPTRESVNQYYQDQAVWEQAAFAQQRPTTVPEEAARLDVDPIIFDPDALAIEVERDKVVAVLEGREPKSMNDLILAGLRFGAAKERMKAEALTLRERLGLVVLSQINRPEKENKDLSRGLVTGIAQGVKGRIRKRRQVNC